MPRPLKTDDKNRLEYISYKIYTIYQINGGAHV